MMKNAFIIITNPRSGSSWFISMLRSRPDVNARGELFNIPLQYPISEKEIITLGRWSDYKKLKKYTVPIFTIFEYLNKFYDGGQSGFKIMLGQIFRNPAVILYLATHPIRIIHLHRDNALDIVLSKAARRVRDVAHSNESVEKVAFTLDPDKTLSEVRTLIRHQRFTQLLCKILPNKVLSVRYEDLVANPRKWDEIQEFLFPESKPAKLASQNRKLNNAPKNAILKNFEEIRSKFASAGLAHLCDN